MLRNAAGGGKPLSKIPQEQVPGVSHRRVGDIVVTAISDGFPIAAARWQCRCATFGRPAARAPAMAKPPRYQESR
jgi:hypothetical protein